MAKKKDLTGTTIGDLFIDRKAPSETNINYWYCICKCGKNIKISTRKLLAKSNTPINCGFCNKIRKNKSTFIK